MNRMIALVLVSVTVCFAVHPKPDVAHIAKRDRNAAPTTFCGRGLLTSIAQSRQECRSHPSRALTFPFTRFTKQRLMAEAGRHAGRQASLLTRSRQTLHQSDLLEEFLLDTTRIFGGAPGEQEFVDVAFDGTNYFAVWHNWMAGGITGARITRDGVLLDTFGIDIGTPGSWRMYPSVAFDGANYFAVWMQFDTLTWKADIYGARVTPAGVILDPDGIPISTAEYEQSLPAVHFDGVNYLVAWSDFRNGFESDICAARVTAGGQVLDPLGIPVSTATGNQAIFRGIGFDGTNFLLVWHDDRDGDEYFDVYGARMTRAGTVLDTAGIRIAVAQNNQGLARVAFDGANYFVTWMDDRDMQEDFRIYAARVTPQGAVLDPSGIKLTDYFGVYPAVAFDRANYFVVWTDFRSGWQADIYGARVTPAGVVIDSSGIAISVADSDQWLPAVIHDGARLFVAWADYRSMSEDPYAARVTTEGTVLDPDGILLAYGYSSPTQQSPAAAFDGANYLAVWHDERNGTSDIYATRVTPQGVILDPQGIGVGTGPDYQFLPAVAFDGTNYLVVWTASPDMMGTDIYGARVSPAGVVLDPAGIPIAASQYEDMAPAIAFDGANYLVVWETWDLEKERYDIYGVRVTPQGAVLQELAISTETGLQSNPTVSFGATDYLVTWEDDRDGDFVMDVYGARVSPAGVVLEPNGIPISASEMDQRMPAVAFDRTNWLVVWEDDRDGDFVMDVYGTRVSPAGVVLEPSGIPISASEMNQRMPAVAFDGANWLVAWGDSRWGDTDIYGARITPAGIVLDPEGMELINRDEYRSEPSISENCRLLTFSGYVSELGTGKALAAFYPGVGVADSPRIPVKTTGLRVLPNPLQGIGSIEMSLAKSGDVILSLLDVTGRRIKGFAAGSLPAGIHRIALDGGELPAGVYLLELRTKKETLAQRTVIVK